MNSTGEDNVNLGDGADILRVTNDGQVDNFDGGDGNDTVVVVGTLDPNDTFSNFENGLP